MLRTYLLKCLVIFLPLLLYTLLCVKKAFSRIDDRNYYDLTVTKFTKTLQKNEVNCSVSGAKVESDEEFMERMRMRMNNRKKLLRRECKKFDGINTTSTIRFVVAHKQKFLYCCIPKAGTTNWKKLFLFLHINNINLKKIRRPVIHEKAKRYSIDSFSLPSGVENYLKLIVVRDPLTRLFSTYKDKLTKRRNGRIRWPETSKKINRIFNEHAKSQASFEDFVKYVVTTDDNILLKVQPGREKERHWMTFYSLCHPCLIDYDVIGKLETIEEDSRYVLQLLGLAGQIKYEKGYGKNGSSQTSRKKVLKSFKNFDISLQNALLNHYSVDYDLFGYEYPTFL